MTTLTIGVNDTRPPMPSIRTSSATEFVYESSIIDESAGPLGDIEAAEATLLKFRKHGREAFERSDAEKPPEEYLTSVEYPLLAELWDNDADSVYDEM